MKHIKIHSFTHLLHLLYCLILALPLCAILARCLYVQFNKNAFESYSGNQTQLVDYQINYKYESNEVNSIDDLIEGNIYYVSFNCIDLDWTAFSNYSPTFSIILNDNFSFIYDYEGYNEVSPGDLYDFFDITLFGGSVDFSYGDLVVNMDIDYTWSLSCDFIYNELDQNSLNEVVHSYLIDYINISSYNVIESVTPVYQEVSTLDNAFEYSLNEFVQNSNFGRLNLVNWFTDVFLDSSNATNMLYLNFINWYMNYALLVSCVYILFLVLMWFVSLARRLIYKGMEM